MSKAETPIKVAVGLPPKYAQPNRRPATRVGRIVLGKQVKKYRADVAWTVFTFRGRFTPGQKVQIFATIYHASARAKLDDDNAVGWLKSMRDGIQDGIGVNDRYFELGAVDQEVDKLRPRVDVTLL